MENQMLPKELIKEVEVAVAAPTFEIMTRVAGNKLTGRLTCESRDALSSYYNLYEKDETVKSQKETLSHDN